MDAHLKSVPMSLDYVTIGVKTAANYGYSLNLGYHLNTWGQNITVLVSLGKRAEKQNK